MCDMPQIAEAPATANASVRKKSGQM